MPRPIWTGSVSFGLVNVPVKLFSAVSPKEVHFHMLHDEDGARIQLKRVCSKEGEEIPYDHIVKGYEVGKGRYVTTTREELDALDPKATRSIDIEDFVDLTEIDPIYYEHTYYLVPDRGADKPYGLLRAAMEKTNKVGIARFVMRTKKYLCAVRPIGRALGLSTMLYADEVVDAASLEDLPRAPAPHGREMALAEQLIETLAGPFEPSKYKDDYRETVLKMLRQKAKGKAITPAPEPERPREVVDLLDALKASLGSRSASNAAEQASPRRSARRARRPARSRPRGNAPASRRGRPGAH